ncbi:DgyrCDS5451 [Dimorphilus gyrociliatus]|uniref:DgyrCDS5451 n=1 Tax=Dimorphilus gyrociliatus TaxID=2664684 RepID=A0A7I8VM86_9ANNE|nr:DgyrCDS5451 [Dimorphilus gyrociliatus]
MSKRKAPASKAKKRSPSITATETKNRKSPEDDDDKTSINAKKNSEIASSSGGKSLKDGEKVPLSEKSMVKEATLETKVDDVEQEDFTDSDDSTPKKPALIKSCPELMNCSSVTDVLQAMEGKVHSKQNKKDGMESEGSDWEEVENAENEDDYVKPSEEVNIKLDHIPGQLKRKSKKERMMEWFKYWMAKYKRDTFSWMHKVHLLLLLAHGRYVNDVLKGDIFRAVSLSVKPSFIFLKTAMKNWGIETLRKLVNSITEIVKMNIKDENVKGNIAERLECTITRGVAFSRTEYILSCIGILQGFGLEVRLVMSFYPLHFREKIPKCHLVAKNSTKRKHVKNPAAIPKKKVKKLVIEDSSEDDEDVPVEEEETEIDEKVDIEETDNNSESKYFSASKKLKKRSSTRIRNKKQSNKSAVKISTFSNSDDSDFEVVGKSQSKKSKKGTCAKEEFKPIKILSESSSDGLEEKIDVDIWCEVYLKKEKKWICVDFVNMDVNCTSSMEDRCSNTLVYVIGFNPDNTMKDLTEKYSAKFNVNNRKLRADHNWWKQTQEIFESKSKRDEDENKLILDKKREEPLPKTINEYKNHALYALKRHLLKFQAIYPPEAAPIGFIRNEEVYVRECVHTLHTRETWTREGRQVKPFEIPYKTVKARKNKKHVYVEEPKAELFGEWQTEVYTPDPVENGRVPRNQYGNVELYKESMLPKGGVHLRLPGLNKVGRKLNIDCVPAVTSWDFHGGFNHPVVDGYVVPEESKDILLAAWDEEQEIMAEKEAQKKEKRVLERWKLLIKGILIKERLRKKYQKVDDSEDVQQSSFPNNKGAVND